MDRRFAKLTDRLIARAVAQFGHPRGLVGSVVGWTMALRSSNRRRNAWAVSLLDVRSHDRVLEIGFGPGIAIREMSRIATAGRVCGVDHSERMLRQASRRNAAALARAGFSDVRTSTLGLRPPVVCVTAVNPPVDEACEAGGEPHAPH